MAGSPLNHCLSFQSFGCNSGADERVGHLALSLEPAQENVANDQHYGGGEQQIEQHLVDWIEVSHGWLFFQFGARTV
jgi:hypothetical protein